MVIFNCTILLRPYGDKIRLKANFVFMSLCLANHVIVICKNELMYCWAKCDIIEISKGGLKRESD